MTLSPKSQQLLIYAFIGIITFIYGALLFNLINNHAVNLLFADQWDFSDYIFDNPSIWEMFAHQHGPHRQGVGAFISLIIGSLTSWNMRVQAFCIGAILVLAALAALYLKYRLFEKLTAWDAIIPVICLSFIQCEIAFPNTNVGYTALPLLFIIIAGIILTLEKPVWRYSLLVVINFLAVFTGFSIFMGVITPFILLFAIVFHWLDKQRPEMFAALAALAVSLLTLALFFNGYSLSPAVDCFQFPHPQPYEYLMYISNMLTMCQGFFNSYKVTFARRFGIILFVTWLALLLYQFWRIIKTRNSARLAIINFLFFSFSILYAVNTAIGRVCLGTDHARSTRYMTLLIPGWIALYFVVLELKPRILRIIFMISFIILFAIIPLRQYKALDDHFALLTAARHKWISCYLETENIEECNRVSKIKIYPDAEATHLKEKLDFLKQKRYNLFSTP